MESTTLTNPATDRDQIVKQIQFTNLDPKAVRKSLDAAGLLDFEPVDTGLPPHVDLAGHALNLLRALPDCPFQTGELDKPMQRRFQKHKDALLDAAVIRPWKAGYEKIRSGVPSC